VRPGSCPHGRHAHLARYQVALGRPARVPAAASGARWPPGWLPEIGPGAVRDAAHDPELTLRRLSDRDPTDPSGRRRPTRGVGSAIRHHASDWSSAPDRPALRARYQATITQHDRERNPLPTQSPAIRRSSAAPVSATEPTAICCDCELQLAVTTWCVRAERQMRMSREKCLRGQRLLVTPRRGPARSS
jgi:hypothetical protein